MLREGERDPRRAGLGAGPRPFRRPLPEPRSGRGGRARDIASPCAAAAGPPRPAPSSPLPSPHGAGAHGLRPLPPPAPASRAPVSSWFAAPGGDVRGAVPAGTGGRGGGRRGSFPAERSARGPRRRALRVRSERAGGRWARGPGLAVRAPGWFLHSGKRAVWCEKAEMKKLRIGLLVGCSQRAEVCRCSVLGLPLLRSRCAPFWRVRVVNQGARPVHLRFGPGLDYPRLSPVQPGSRAPSAELQSPGASF